MSGGQHRDSQSAGPVLADALEDAAELIDTLTSNLPAGHPLRKEAEARAKQCVARLYSLAKSGCREEGLYYLQDTRQYVGNCPMWWAKDGNGYTTRLDEAQTYTLDEAMSQHTSRATDVPWPCSMIDPLGRLTVDVQHMGSISNHTKNLTANYTKLEATQ